MNLLKPFEFVPGVKWFESEMHDTLFQHSVFGAIVFLIVYNTGVYKFVKDTIFSVSGVKLDGNTLQLVHAVVFAVIMYFGSMYLFAPLLGEGMDGSELNALCSDMETAMNEGTIKDFRNKLNKEEINALNKCPSSESSPQSSSMGASGALRADMLRETPEAEFRACVVDAQAGPNNYKSIQNCMQSYESKK